MINYRSYLEIMRKFIIIISISALILGANILSGVHNNGNNGPIVLFLSFSELQQSINKSFILIDENKIILSSAALEPPEHVYLKIIRNKVEEAIEPLGLSIINFNNFSRRIVEYSVIENNIRNEIHEIVSKGIDVDSYLYATNDRYIVVFTIYEEYYNNTLASKLESIAIRRATVNNTRPLIVFIIRDFTIKCKFLSFSELNELNSMLAEINKDFKVADVGCSIIGQFVYLEGIDKDLTSYMFSPDGLIRFYNEYSKLIIKIADFIRNATGYFETPINIELFNFSLIKPYTTVEPINGTETPSTNNAKVNESNGLEGEGSKANTIDNKLNKELSAPGKEVETTCSNINEKNIDRHNVYITVLIILAAASIMIYVVTNNRYK